jgi:hypothetical protein
MRKILLVAGLTAGLCVFAGAQAQIKCWTENGRRVCGDAPPAGAKTKTIRTDPTPAPAPAPATAGKDPEDAKKAPMTAAEREAEAKRKQAEDKKNAEKAAAKDKMAAEKVENCARAQAALRQYESGARISGVDSKGERYFLDESQVAAEAAKARRAVQELCS